MQKDKEKKSSSYAGNKKSKYLKILFKLLYMYLIMQQEHMLTKYFFVFFPKKK